MTATARRPRPYTLAGRRPFTRCRHRFTDRQRCALIRHDGTTHALAAGFDVVFIDVSTLPVTAPAAGAR